MRYRLAMMVILGCAGGGVLLSTAGCEKASDDCKVGAEGCACTSGMSCDTGLSCASNRCVKLPGGSAPVGTGGTVGDGGLSTPVGMTPPVNMTADLLKICDDFAGKLCDKFIGCIPFGVSLLYGDRATCVERTKIECTDNVKAPDSGLTAGTAAACLAAAATASCDDLLYRKVAACEIKGKRSNGMACGTDEQCTTSNCAKNDSICGVCADYVKAGNKCQEEDDCEPGLICNDDKRCVRPAEGGTACSATQPCRIGNYCRNGSCAGTASNGGENCQDAQGCELFKGLYCNLTARKCQAINSVSAGQRCGFENNELRLCSRGGVCLGAAGASICSAAAADGETCGAAASNRPCLAPAQCFKGRCSLPNSSTCN